MSDAPQARPGPSAGQRRAEVPRQHAATPSRAGTIPLLPRTYVPRPRLWQRLDESTGPGITTLIAPVGAGKTLGVAGWVRARSSDQARGALWVHGDAGWQPQRFAALLAAAGGDRPDAGPDAGPDAEGGAPGGVRLVVVDDAHDLPPATIRLIDERLNQAPTSMRLLLLGRWDPSLTRLVPELLGYLTVLRGDLLRMSHDGAAALVRSHLRAPDPVVVEAVVERAGGWCAALVLTARTVDAAADPAAAARRLPHGDAALVDQVATGVFEALTARQRHLLLCVGGESPVAAEAAAHLTGDPRAGELLDELERTGLLVSQIRGDEPDVRFRIHPLLVEVVRRRIAQDGDDVARARATTVRAVRLDLGRGHAPQALARLVRLGAVEAAADVLSRDGVHIVLSHGNGREVADLTRTHPEVIDAHPSTWLPVALDRWLANDIDGARHWSERILGARSGLGPSHQALVRLWRARLGLEPARPAVARGQQVVHALQGRTAWTEPDAQLLPVLAMELGVAQNWLGDLTAAGESLTTAVALSRGHGLSALAASSLSHLAMTEYMAGRESAAVEVATEALSRLGAADVWRMEFAPTRAGVSLFLGGVVDLPWVVDPVAGPYTGTGSRTHGGDLSTRFWLRIRDALLAVLSGSLADAERILGAPVDDPQLQDARLPQHLRVALLVGRALLAALSADLRTLLTVEAELASMGVLGEAAFVAGLHADCSGDRRAAVDAFAAAATGASYAQPPTAALSLTCEAQLRDALGEPQLALERLSRAATLTEVRRNAVPFLGWSRQGTPVETLLGRLAARRGSPWVHALALATAGQADVIRRLEASTPLRSEPRQTDESLVGPSLSPREREVLGELARGATYADIGSTLFLSANTVKTHVSSLYSKLGVSRRSEALTVARARHLL